MDKSMSLSLFTITVIQKMQNKMGENYNVFSSVVRKNNGIELVGIVVKEKDCNTSPTIYMNNFYEEYKKGTSVEEIVERVREIFLQNRFDKSVDISGFADYERAKGQIAFKLINYEKNWELLKKIPHKVFFNLAIVFYYAVLEPPFEGKASILIQHSHVKNWGIREDELYQNAMDNTPFLLPAKIENIEEVMFGLLKKDMEQEHNGEKNITAEVFGKDMAEELLYQLKENLNKEKDQIPMYVLSNKNKILGASCMLYPGVLKNFANEKKSNLFILPSSIHEVILLPETENMNKEDLLDMVTEINKTQVEEMEVLADAVYFYDRTCDKLERLC